MPLATYSIIAAVSLVSLAGFASERLYQGLIFSVERILRRKEFYRVLTSQFLHADMFHLAFNMISFYAFARGIESAFGFHIVIVIFFGSAVAGDILALALKRNHPGYRAVGASGGVSGIIFASIFLLPGGSVIVFPLPVPIPAWVYALLFILATVYGIGRGGGDIGHEAHLGGALAGLCVTGLLFPAAVISQPLLLAGVTVPVLIFSVYYMARH